MARRQLAQDELEMNQQDPDIRELTSQIILEEADRYFSEQMRQAETQQTMNQIMQTVESMRSEYASHISDDMKQRVVNRLYNESSVIVDQSFVESVADHTPLTQFGPFQEAIQASPGYQQYCSQLLRHSALFACHQQNNHDVNVEPNHHQQHGPT